MLPLFHSVLRLHSHNDTTPVNSRVVNDTFRKYRDTNTPMKKVSPLPILLLILLTVVAIEYKLIIIWHASSRQLPRSLPLKEVVVAAAW
jgi:hypothetical protein